MESVWFMVLKATCTTSLTLNCSDMTKYGITFTQIQEEFIKILTSLGFKNNLSEESNIKAIAMKFNEVIIEYNHLLNSFFQTDTNQDGNISQEEWDLKL